MAHGLLLHHLEVKSLNRVTTQKMTNKRGETMKQLTKAKHFLVMLLAMSLMTACLPILNDEEKSSERTNGQTEPPETPETPNGGQTTQAPETPEREVRRSPLPEGDTPAHRQNRRSDGPDMDLRSGDGPERHAVCRARW